MPRARGLGVIFGNLEPGSHDVRMLANSRMDDLFYAAIDATEEATANALLAAGTTRA
jgi:L-aminopeptidase/D-esterase-like protein